MRFAMERGVPQEEHRTDGPDQPALDPAGFAEAAGPGLVPGDSTIADAGGGPASPGRPPLRGTAGRSGPPKVATGKLPLPSLHD